ncbi:zealexin A1 synthase-like [Lolium rigidum]|uniref:zealexin A1 synthase-like n=1 Tax=Lolium rigidum TaxID=89674 RepID=UPI001F5DC98E|nr:zealexin A1 synthase-like [Lolium rigidum]
MAETMLVQLVRCYNFLFVLVATILAKLKLRRGAVGLNLPPGPLTLPVIGNTHNLLGALPHQAMHRLAQQHGPVMLLRLGDVHTLVLSSAEAAREAMEVHGAAFGYRHEYATAGELLGPTHVRSFRSVREEEAESLASRIFFTMSYMGPVPVRVDEVVKAMMNNVFTRISVGVFCPQWEAYLEALDRATGLMSGLSLTDLFPASRLARALRGGSLREARRRIQSIADAMIREHKTAMEREEEAGDAGRDVPTEDILTTLLRLQSNGGVTLTNESVSGILLDIFSMGSEAATTIIWAMSELIRSPRIMAIAQSEVRRVLHSKTMAEANIDGQLHYLQMVIRETFRLHPPLSLLHPMMCTERRRIMGYDVLPGTTVFVNLWAIGRDEQNWTNASEFIPERFEGEKGVYSDSDFSFFPYDVGQRMFPGKMFVVANVEFALASLLYHFDWNLPDSRNPEELDMAEAYGITTHRRTQLLLNATNHFGML